MLHRLRARLVFPKSSGMATWCRDQMSVRHDQAKHINEGLANEEKKYNTLKDYDDDNEEFKCDLPLMDREHAEDAYNTLTDESVWSHLAEDVGVNWVEHHICDHEDSESERTGCKVESIKKVGEPINDI